MANAGTFPGEYLRGLDSSTYPEENTLRHSDPQFELKIVTQSYYISRVHF